LVRCASFLSLEGQTRDKGGPESLGLANS
jgi:hypothetical protein